MEAIGPHVYARLAIDNGGGTGWPMIVQRAPIGERNWTTFEPMSVDGVEEGDLKARGDQAVAFVGGDGDLGRPKLMTTDNGGADWTEREIPCRDWYPPQVYLPAGNDRIYAFCAPGEGDGPQRLMVPMTVARSSPSFLACRTSASTSKGSTRSGTPS